MITLGAEPLVDVNRVRAMPRGMLLLLALLFACGPLDAGRAGEAARSRNGKGQGTTPPGVSAATARRKRARAVPACRPGDWVEYRVRVTEPLDTAGAAPAPGGKAKRTARARQESARGPGAAVGAPPAGAAASVSNTVRCRITIVEGESSGLRARVMVREKRKIMRETCAIADFSELVKALPRLPPANKVKRRRQSLRVAGRSLETTLESWRVAAPTGMVRVKRWLCPRIPFGIGRLEMGAFTLEVVAFGNSAAAGGEPSFPYGKGAAGAPDSEPAVRSTAAGRTGGEPGQPAWKPRAGDER